MTIPRLYPLNFCDRDNTTCLAIHPLPALLHRFLVHSRTSSPRHVSQSPMWTALSDSKTMTSTQRVMTPSRTNAGPTTTFRVATPTVVKLLLLLIAQLPLLHATPLHFSVFRAHTTEDEPMPAQSPTLWIYLLVAVALVLLGGAFAGLTIALMGQVFSPPQKPCCGFD